MRGREAWRSGQARFFLEKLREKNKNVILVDSGDLFFPPGSTPQSLSGKERELFDPKIDLYIKSYNKMKYDAFTPGETDLSLGVQELLKISRECAVYLSFRQFDRAPIQGARFCLPVGSKKWAA